MPHALQDRILPGESFTVGDILYASDNQKWAYFEVDQGLYTTSQLKVQGYKQGSGEVEADILTSFRSAETAISIEMWDTSSYPQQPTLVVRSSPGGSVIWWYRAPVEFIDAHLDYLVLQSDGNLVFYANDQTSVIWASGTDGFFN